MQTASIFDLLFRQVDTASNGQEAWEKYQNGNYDIVFTDIRMPKMDGLALSRRIKKENAMQKVVIISAYNSPEYESDAAQIGVDAFLFKPISMEELVQTLRRLI